MTKKDPYTKDGDTRFTLRIQSDLLACIREEAEKNKRSTGKQIEFILEHWVSEKTATERRESDH